MLRTVLLLLTLALVAGCDSGDDGGTVAASGTIVNTFGRPLAGATVSLTPADDAGAAGGAATAGFARSAVRQMTCTTQTSSTGQFQCDLPPGTYTMTVTVPGYSTSSVTVVVDAAGNATITFPPVSGDGAINATFLDSVTGAVLSFATVQCSRRLPDGTLTAFEFETTTDAQGVITVQDVFLGEAECIVQAGASQIPVVITITEETDGTIPVTQPPAAGEIRIVLSWGDEPSDLDAHLTGPGGPLEDINGDPLHHVYYSNRTYVADGDTLAVLDRDDTSSFGPETMTFRPVADGVYRYTVHNYSFRQSTEGGQSLFDSPTRVEVYDATGLRQTYQAPAPTDQNMGVIANAWRVIEITKNGTQLSFSGNTGANPTSPQAGLRYVLANDPGDLGVFLDEEPLPAKAVSE